MCTSPCLASARNACRTVPRLIPRSSCSSGTDGRASPGGSVADRIAARSWSAACCHAGRGSAGSGLRSGMSRCSVNGLPVHARLPFQQRAGESVHAVGECFYPVLAKNPAPARGVVVSWHGTVSFAPAGSRWQSADRSRLPCCRQHGSRLPDPERSGTHWPREPRRYCTGLYTSLFTMTKDCDSGGRARLVHCTAEVTGTRRPAAVTAGEP
jgi:hypothetical protein